MMQIIADTHVHLYDCYDFDVFFCSAFNNLGKHGNCTAKALFLAERNDCNFLSQLKEKGSAGKYKVEVGSSEDCVKIIDEGVDELYLFAGRQVVTKERLEVLSLLSNTMIDDGLSAQEVIRASRDAGGVPVLSWALGKWTFSRGKVVEDLINKFKPGELLIGDTYMRPASCSEPTLMQLARRSGLGVLAGTDPLPFAGDEKVVGQYASLIEGDLNTNDPAGALRQLLSAGKPGFTAVGGRSSAMNTVKRWLS